MALVLADRVQETTTTSGTGTITLGGAIAGYQSFAVVGNGNTCFYTIVDSGAWEVGIGTYSTTGPSLARTTILSNSNGNTSPITLSGSSASVFLTYPSEKSVNLDASDNVSPLGTVASGVWQGTTIGVAYGGTGVTSSSGANSVVLRDANQNISVNRLNQGLQTTTAAAGTTTLSAASQFNQALVGTGGQTFKLPDATTLTDTTTFQFNNNATGTLTIIDYANATVGTIASGGAAGIALLSNATVGGTWDVHAYIPENVTWGTNALALGSTVITGGTWNGGTIAYNYGGTGLTSFTSGGAVYANSSTTLTTGTLPITAGGTGQTTASAAFNALSPITSTGDLILGNGSNSATRLPIGTNGYFLTSNGTTASWAAVPTSMVYPGSGIPVSTGSAWSTSKASPSGVIVGTTDTQTLTNKQWQAYNETVTTVGTVSTTTYNIDLSLSNIFDITLGNNVTFTFTNPPASGISRNCTVILRQDATGSRLATFTNAKYTDGTAPILSTGANQIDVLTFFTLNGGSFWFGTFAMANVS